MTTRWQDIRCASIPVEDLPVLADLRREAGIRVSIAGGPGLDLLGRRSRTRRVRSWSNGSCRCPESRCSPGAVGTGIGRASTCRRSTCRSATGREASRWTGSSFPRPMTASPPADAPPDPIPLRLVRDARSRPRPAAAVRCRLDRLAEWAERATSARIESLSGAWSADPDGGPERGRGAGARRARGRSRPRWAARDSGGSTC